MRRIWGLAAAALLAGCSGSIVPPSPTSGTAAPRPAPVTGRVPNIPGNHLPVRQPTAATPIAPMQGGLAGTGLTAATSGVVAGPPIATLPIAPDQAAQALDAFRASCTSIVRRTDTTGLTRGSDWQPACDAARSIDDRDALSFFQRWFETVQVGNGQAFATGYFVPEIAGSRDRRAGYDVPIYGRPTDLIDVDLGRFSDALKGKKVRGRVDGTNLVPFYDRSQIEAGAIARSAPVIAWAADPIEVFFLQIQGSGRLRLPDGGVMVVGYASQNGRDYTGIGKLMRDRGLLAPGQASMQGIMDWLRSHPDQAQALMDENKSFVFFRELDTAPLGALGVPVAGGVSAAVDPKFVPLGAPVFLSMDRTDASSLWVAQDTGGAIRGANRFDTFWGWGADARAIAGGMSAHGTAFLLLPRGTLARLNGGAAGGGATAYP